MLLTDFLLRFPSADNGRMSRVQRAANGLQLQNVTNAFDF